MTGHEVTEKSPAAKRKEAQREREAEAGIIKIEHKLSEAERDLMDRCRELRGGYSVTEYLNTLVRRDSERLAVELAKIEGESCGRCGKPLPQGCKDAAAPEGKEKGVAGCWLTYNALRLYL